MRRRASLLTLALFTSASLISFAPAAQGEPSLILRTHPGDRYHVDADLTVTNWDSKSRQISLSWSNDEVEDYDGITRTYVAVGSTPDSQGIVTGGFVAESSGVGMSSVVDKEVSSSWPGDFYVQIRWACYSEYGEGSCPSGTAEDNSSFYDSIFSEAVFVSGSTKPSPTPTRSPTPTPTPTQEPPGVSIANANVFEGETERTLNFRVSLNGMAMLPVNVGVTLSLAGSTATLQGGQNPDFSITPGTLSLGPGAGPGGSYVSSRLFPVTVLGDDRDEPDETVVLTLNNPVNATIARGRATGTIYDNDGMTVDTGVGVGAVPAGAATVVHAAGTAACPGTTPCTVAAGPNVRLGPGDQIQTGAASGAQIILSDGSTFVMAPNSTVRWEKPNLFSQPGGRVWYSLYRALNQPWKVKGVNGTVLIQGTEFTVETSKKSDRVSTYEGSVKATGEKGKAVVVKTGYRTVCPNKSTCGAPKKFTARTGEFWESQLCPVGTSCLVDANDSTGPLDISEVVITRSASQVRIEIRTYEPWDSDLLETLYWPNGSVALWFYKDWGMPVYYVRPEYRGRRLMVWAGTSEYGEDPATVERPDQNSIVVTFDRALLDATGANVWIAYARVGDSSEPGRYKTEWSCTGENPVAGGLDRCTDYAPGYPGTHPL